MNERFYLLPEERQQKIINAGFKIFSQNSYKKSPVGEIAEAAGISKSLLFHYFKNKKELYLFLVQRCCDITVAALKESGCYESTDIFDSMLISLKTKVNMMRMYPDLGTFSIKAYYEKDPEVVKDIEKYIKGYAAYSKENIPARYNMEQFAPGMDFKMMFRDMYLASEGFVWEKLQYGKMDPDEMEKEYQELIKFWKSIYLRKA